jgi:nucleotidyltransferase AbiEii toxin of type IV toxin-antitoxin system
MDNISPESWKSTLRSAIAILRDLDDKGFGQPDFTMGGGTVLMFRFAHRMSHDIDLFITDVQWLTLISPRLNDFSASYVLDYVEQANSVKLVTPHGDIDIIAAAPTIPDLQGESLEFDGETIALDHTAEILGKKLLYRASTFQARDVFDMAAAIAMDPTSAATAARMAASKAPILDRRLRELGRLSAEELERGILLLERGRGLLSGMIERVRTCIADAAAP